MTNVAMMATDPEPGARKVGTYDIPDERSSGNPPPPPEPRRGLSWLWWILGLLVLLALAAWAFQSCMPATAPGTQGPTTGDVTTVPGGDAAGGAVVGDTAAVCTAVDDYNALAGQAPAIGADTPVADVQAYYGQVQTAGTALTSAAAAVPDLDLTAFNESMATLGGAVTGLTGDVVGDAAEGLTAAFTGVQDAFTGVGTAAGC